MTNLVHSLLFRSGQLSVLINGLLFEEIPNLVTRGQEVVVANMVIITRGELRL